MDLLEHQAKELFAAYGIPVPRGKVAGTPQEARAIAEEFADAGTPRVVVKAQVRVGGRGKAGGVAVVSSPQEAESAARAILALSIKGHPVRSVLVEQAGAIAEEYYLSFLLDRAGRTFLSICSARGGMEIEEVAARTPEAVAKVPVSALDGVGRDDALAIAEAGSLPPQALDAAAVVIERLWKVLKGEDATLVEVNPLVLTEDGRIVALDGKVTLDDSAAFRRARRPYGKNPDGDPLEARAAELGLNYVRLEGEVGVIGNGAGLVMSTLDVVAGAGERLGGVRPANFLDIGGGASADVMANGLRTVLADPAVKSVLVNVFGGITACDAVAEGIVRAHALLAGGGEPLDRPIVVRLDGNRAAEGRDVLDRAALPFIEQADGMDGAARRAAELASVGA